ncbi:hypothetical protein Nepgr_018793 [Nepenthes gracilis]|uniref:Uncharacterized protein n=1 Tax=Nepenthes gracilis TaxID=150966 RepID=A0AAD3SUS3_NEPGR|nr:hypothetical protein Nepgr_018793 [Nepenthes gracilis]
MHFACVCVEVRIDGVLPRKIRLTSGKFSANVDESSVDVEVEYQGKLSRNSSNWESGHNTIQCKTMMEFRPTGRILVGPHSRVTQRSPKRNMPKILQLSAQGDASKDDCADEIKPQNKAFREADDQLKSNHFSAVYQGHDVGPASAGQVAPKCLKTIANKSQTVAIRHADVQLNSFNYFTKCPHTFSDAAFLGKAVEDQEDVQ